MCGRARCTLRAEDVPRACYRDGVPARYLHMDRYRTSFNVSPGSYMPIVRRDNEADGNGVAVHCMKWGLIPSFTKKTEKPDFYKMFNARSESISEKASFRRLLPKNRCLVAVEGFYEWKKDGSKKQPYYIHLKDGRPLVFAALYDSWQSSEGGTLYTFTILTTSSSSALQWLHDRMPVILGDKGSADTWLDESSASKFNTLLKPYENPDLVWYPVTPAMGKTIFDGPDCIKEIPLKLPEKNLISKFFTAKEPKKEETNRENKSLSRDLPVGMKQEPTAEEAMSSNKSIKGEEPSEEKKIRTDEYIKTDLPKILKEEHEIQCHVETDNKESNQEMRSPRTLKEEPKIEDQTGVPSSSEVEKNDAKHPAKHPIKRDYEAFSAGKKPTKLAENVERRQVKKKQDVKSSGDKQSTLLSYFGKK